MIGKRVILRFGQRVIRQEPGGKETSGTALTITYDDGSQSFEWKPDEKEEEL